MSGVAPWDWRDLDAAGARTTWETVARFVDWLVLRYELGDLVPACWWRHGAITEELTALWAAWVAAYVDPEASPDAPLAWHERFAGCRARLSEWDRLGCAQRGHRDDLPTEWTPDAQDFAAFVGDDLATRAGAHRLVALSSSEAPAGSCAPSSADPRPPDPEGRRC